MQELDKLAKKLQHAVADLTKTVVPPNREADFLGAVLGNWRGHLEQVC